MIFETRRLWGMVGVCYSVFTKGKQFGVVHPLSYILEKAAV